MVFPRMNEKQGYKNNKFPTIHHHVIVLVMAGFLRMGGGLPFLLFIDKLVYRFFFIQNSKTCLFHHKMMNGSKNTDLKINRLVEN